MSESASSRWPTRISRKAAAALALGTVIFMALNICVSLLPSMKLDLTEGRIYTLSPATRTLLAQMDEQIHLRLYVSRALEQSSGGYAAYAAHVRELLRLYVAKSHDKLKLEVIDPASYSPEEDRAVGLGLRAIPLNGNGGSGSGDSQVYFGLAGTNSTDSVETIPFLAPEREPFLEYDVTKMIAALEAPHRTIVGVIDGVGAFGGGHPWAALEQVRQQFDLRPVRQDLGKIDSDVSVLLIVHPKNLDPAMLFAIDQFVLNGGHALVFVDPDAESVIPATPSYINGHEVPGGGSSDLEPLLKAWGVGYDPSMIVGDWDQAMRIEAESFGRPVTSEFPPFIADQPPYLSAGDPVTGDLKVINLVTAGALTSLPNATTSFTPLIQSSPHAALLNAADAAGMTDPLGLIAKYTPGNTSYTMAARLMGAAGAVKSSYPDGPPKTATGQKSTLSGPFLKQAQKPVEVIVVADVDLLADRSWVQLRDVGSTRVVMPFANNGDFLINAVESLSGDTALASLRARGIGDRPLTRIVARQRAADDRYRATEEELSRQLDETRRHLLTLAPDSGAPDSGAPASRQGKALLSGEQQDTVKRFRTEMVEERRQLRDVQHDLRRGIDRLETAIKLANILLVPLAVIVFSLLIAWRGISIKGGRRR